MNSQMKKGLAVQASIVLECSWQFKEDDPSSLSPGEILLEKGQSRT